MTTTLARGSADAKASDRRQQPRAHTIARQPRAHTNARQFETSCTITIEQSSEAFHAHVDLPDHITMEPGDKVRVHGDPISIPFGSREVFERTATVTRAGPLKRAMVRMAAYFDLAELYEVSFNAGRIK